MTQVHDLDDLEGSSENAGTGPCETPGAITFQGPVWDDETKSWRARTAAENTGIALAIAACPPIEEDDFPPEVPPPAALETERPPPAPAHGAPTYPIGLLKPSPTQPRKTFKNLEELAESIRVHGILQPLVARKRTKSGSAHLELVFGERRLRAAKMAGLEEVPVLVVEMSDDEVLEVQIVENVQREDVDALEEADGFRVLHEKRGRSVPEIAAKIGKSIAYVYARLKLCALGPEGRMALVAGKLTDSTALLIARVPLALQSDALKELEPREHDYAYEEDDGSEDGHAKQPDPLGAREAMALIQRRFMLRLADAPFDPKDAELLPAAGACSTCPKRTGSQPELFPDVKVADTCTDPTCFEKKRDAVWAKRKAKALADGIPVVEGKRAKEYFPYGSHLVHTSGKVDLDAEDYSDGKRRTHRERLGKRIEDAKLPVTLVRTDDGKVHELVPASLLKKLLPKPKEVGDEPERPRPVEKNASERLKDEAERAAWLAALGLVVKKFEAKEPDRALWRVLVEREIDCAVCDVNEVLARRGLKSISRVDQDAWIASLNVGELRGLFVELGLTDDAEHPSERGALPKIAAALKIDLKQLVAKELARLKEEAKKPPAPAAKLAAKSPLGKVALTQMPARDAKAITKAKKQLAKKGTKR